MTLWPLFLLDSDGNDEEEKADEASSPRCVDGDPSVK